MTRDEARRRAVEAAAKTWWADGYDNNPSYNEDMRLGMSAAIAAYERAMADAGWRMVRDVVAHAELPAAPEIIEPILIQGRALHNERVRGWNACRAAMLAEDG